MKKRTAEIIMVCKGQHDFGEFDTFKQAVAAYMSDRCLTPVERYTDAMLNEIIWTTALDYIDGMRDYPPSSFFYDAKRAFDLHNNPFSHSIRRIDMYEAVCVAFQSADVRHNGEYINGFTEENTGFVYKTVRELY